MEELQIVEKSFSFPAEIENIEALKKELKPKLDYYRSLVVTADSIKQAAADKAALNRLKKAIEDKRIEIKKLYLQPYEVLEKQCKELVQMIDEPVSMIDSQVKKFAEAEKMQKYEELKKFFDTINPLDFIKLDDVINPKWANKGEKLESLKNELIEKCGSISSDLAIVEAQFKDLPIWIPIYNKFCETKGALGETMQYASNLKAQYYQEQARKEAEIQTERESYENERRATEEAQATTTPTAEPTTDTVENKPIIEEDITGTFTVTASRAKIAALGKFMKANGIKFTVSK